jgi:2-polyprenyl-3-methyl-5-hydroxy-6-metoxy-1,4-benzoquinol methylase
MPILQRLSQRRLQPELMDQPDVNPAQHRGALRGLERINWLSGATRVIWPSIAALAAENPSRPLRVLDVATGAGDVPIRLWRKAARRGLPIEISACDKSRLALSHAEARAKARDTPIKFFEWDALRGGFPGEYDIVISSLFLHHLDEHEAVQFLMHIANTAKMVVLVNDLERSRLGFLLAYAGTRLLTLSPVAHTDGPRSVEGAFSCSEALALARRAGMAEACITRRWPCRYLLSWRRNSAQGQS